MTEKMTLRPIRNHIIVKREKPPERTESGLYMPETAKQDLPRGIVVAVGPGKRENGDLQPVEVKVGDIVFFVEKFTREVEDQDGEKYLVMTEETILCVDDVGE